MNNVTYTRYAESARVKWAQNYAVHIDPGHKEEWSELWTSTGDGMILRSMRTDYKFVSLALFITHFYIDWMNRMLGFTDMSIICIAHEMA